MALLKTFNDEEKALQKQRERGLLGKMLYDADFRAEFLHKINARDFMFEEHAIVFREIAKVTREDGIVDTTLFMRKFGSDNVPMLDDMIPGVNYSDVAKTLHKEGIYNRFADGIVRLHDNMGTDGFDLVAEASKIYERLQKSELDEIGVGNFSEYLQSYADIVEQYKPSEILGNTGISDLDFKIGGFERSYVYVVYGGEGSGKTAFGTQIFHECMKAGTTCMYVSNEMRAFDITSRMLARVTNWSAKDIAHKKLMETNPTLYANAYGEVDDLFRKTKSTYLERAYEIGAVKRAVRAAVTNSGVKLLIVDHLNNFRGDRDIYKKISNVAHELQDLAQELNVAVVMLSQVSAENKKNPDPETISAKGAKDVDEVANIVMYISRRKISPEGGGVLSKEEDPAYAKIFITKNRDGYTGMAWSKFKTPSLVFENDDL